MATRQRLQPEHRRQQLIEVARELYAAGQSDAGFEEVAQLAGVQRSLLYRYFPGGRADLYQAVVEDSWRQLVTQVDTTPERPVTSKLPRNVAVFLDLAEAGNPALLVVWQSRHVPDPHVQAIGREARRAWALAMARNHLGPGPVEEPLIAALCGYLAMSELLVEEWRLYQTIDRANVEQVLERILPPLVKVARDA